MKKVLLTLVLSILSAGPFAFTVQGLENNLEEKSHVLVKAKDVERYILKEMKRRGLQDSDGECSLSSAMEYSREQIVLTFQKQGARLAKKEKSNLKGLLIEINRYEATLIYKDCR